MIKLVELLGTVYLAEHYLRDVSIALEQHKHLDIAGARLTPAIASALMNATYNGSMIIDSENEERNSLLEENRRRLTLDYCDTPLPKLESMKELKAYLKSLNEETVYSVNSETNLNFPLAVLVQLYAPQIKLDFKDNLKRFYMYVGEILYREDLQEIVNSTSDYNLIVGNTIRAVHISEKSLDKQFYVFGIGDIDWRSLNQKYIILPSYFGEVKTQNDPKLENLWVPVIKKAITDLDNYYSTKLTTIRDFLGGNAQ